MGSIDLFKRQSLEGKQSKFYRMSDSLYFPGVIDMCAPMPLHGGRAGRTGKVPVGLSVAMRIKKCVPLLHSPVGCAFQRKINPSRPWELFFDTPCSGITEVDTVYGGNDRLYDAIKAVAEKYQPELILVISTCAPDLIGDDFDSVINQVKEEISCDVVYTIGNPGHTAFGIQDTLASVVDQLVSKPSGKLKGSVNICTNQDHNSKNRISELVELLEGIGAKINGVYFVGNSVEEIKNLANAEMNVADSRKAWCELAGKKFDMKTVYLNQFRSESFDYRPGTINGTVHLLQHIAKELELEDSAFDKIENMRKSVEDELAVWKEKLSGRRIAMRPFHGSGPMMVKDLGMECGVVFINTGRLKRDLKEEAVDEIIQINVDFIKKYQRSEPCILFNQTPEQEVKAIRENDVELAVNPRHFTYYLENGIRIFDDAYFRRHHDQLGFEFIQDLAKELVMIFEKPVSGESLLLSLLDYSNMKEYPHMTEYWANIADCFQTIWFCDKCKTFCEED